MNFFKRLFTKSEPDTQPRAGTLIKCPRCLGKGHVDKEDIRRLEQELSWNPGRCVYCNGFGKVEADMISKVAVNEEYFTTALTQKERLKVIAGDPKALDRMQKHNERRATFIADITRMYFMENMEVEDIVEVYLQQDKGLSPTAYQQRKEELTDYIRKVASRKK
ncbi:hypothetical protein [Chitinophaga sp. Cy-1792]|uniref:hypothetical protein n=1 Tax=Chitinophaga sp. Cy-1792 TaxID=2608339 RepID=UPI00141DF2F1|nr:hypothetical protein [Chitinophaga sp. Cy-1792]NIG53416.1 hypothetical protein [Chitinophaga sp. Cy-1792]